MMAASGMPCTLPVGEVSGVLMSACASIQIKPIFCSYAPLLAEKLRDAGDCSRGYGMIAAQNKRNLSRFQRLQ